DEVKGQDHIVTTLRNQIRADRIGHAYLFCGTRGTGKTSVAKIFAKAVNCENPQDGNPCGICPTCQAIATASSMNVIEIDAASNNGVDNIRQIVEEVSYSPASGKYKVYIIDEVHMLSIGAFNALLKTLEEPPSYAIFILATTEAHKIPITILSRCQRYDFKRITIEIIVARLQELMKTEGMQVEEKALRYLAKTADGSMRDALSLLDQCMAFHYGKALTYDLVLDVLGAVDTQVFSDLLRAVTQKNILAAIDLLEEIVMQGRELTQFVSDFTWYLRNLLLVKTSDHVEDVIDVSTEHMLRLQEEAQLLEADTIMRYIRIFSELSGQIKYATQKRILIEMSIIKLCTPSMEINPDTLLDRIRELENKIEAGVTMVPAQTQESNVAAQPAVTGKVRPILPKAIPDDIKTIVKQWTSITNGMAQPAKSYLKNANLSLDKENHLMIVLEDGPPSDYYIQEKDHRITLEQCLSDIVGKQIAVTIQTLASGTRFEDTYVDLSPIHMDIEIEE
ncbi:MAG: DNA polymerase III subunit gamma/tau, partial [Lachnospiraceae bacterium]